MADALSQALGWKRRAEALRKLRPSLQASTRARPRWRSVARPEQLAPGSPGAALKRSDWAFWLVLAGRGFGKTRSGAEWCIERARALPGSHGALVAATSDDARKVMLSSGLEGIEGASGILAVSPPDFRPTYEPSKRTVTWPNGTVATLYSAEEPNRLRGPQHHWGWVDEIAAWEKEGAAWDQFLFGLRLGARPQACITSTPRPIKLVRDLLKNPRTVVTKGSTYDNRANLAPTFFDEIVNRYEGTRLGRQELHAELLEDVPGALWNRDRIEQLRRARPLQFQRLAVAIDPAVTNKADSDETGIIAGGLAECACRGALELHGFLLHDASGRHSPDAWARRAIGLYTDLLADRIVAEVNNGGDLVEVNLRTVDPYVPYRAVRAAHGKRTRAEPVAALYEQGKVHHVMGAELELLEDQMCTWDPLAGGKSPDRLDAAVWLLTDLMLDGAVPVPVTTDAVRPSRYAGGDDDDERPGWRR